MDDNKTAVESEVRPKLYMTYPRPTLEPYCVQMHDIEANYGASRADFIFSFPQ